MQYGTTLWKNEKFTLISPKKIRQINYLVILLIKPLLSRNFGQKRVRVNFRNFHTVKWVLMTNQWSNTEKFRDIILISHIF